MTAPVIRLQDYQPPAFCIAKTELVIDLDYAETRVAARHQVHRLRDDATDLVLDCEALELSGIAIDGDPLTSSQYRISERNLTLFNVPATFELAIENTIRPDKNTALSGLYKSGEMLCTQCEAEGFRRITPAIDRPDNLGEYTVTLRADKKRFPLLLCNGNLIKEGDCEDHKKHFTTWHDPFPKPTYLFAIVAGDLACREDFFITQSGRKVALRFFAEARDIDKCAHGMASLKRAMAWDEKVYGREYDLDLFNVVAVGDFNMGAMENKSLNIFNTQYVLADSSMATDADFENVEAVIGHEYFHNWSGNRVTCRDWFQLSLKEGFTVFREQQFSADMGSPAVKRIDDVAALRGHQFGEDAGPMAHAVRPDSYIEINNFYTATVYSKGAEVIRMLHALLGAKTFRRGTDLYFDRHDGQAVTTDDFIKAMESVSGMDLRQFKNWYNQAGTPIVNVETAFDAARESFEITLKQSCPPTPGQARKAPFVIPIKAALFDRHGKRINAKLESQSAASDDALLVLSEKKQTFRFSGAFKEKPVASLLRTFSAPIELRQRLSEDELALLLSHDDDPFNRWEAGQKLFLRHILTGITKIQSGEKLTDNRQVSDGFYAVLTDTKTDPALQAAILTLPDAGYVSEQMKVIDPAAIYNARQNVKRHLAQTHREELLQRYNELNAKNDGTVNAEMIAVRSLRDTCLAYLTTLDDAHELAADLLQNPRCMTDAVAALRAIADAAHPRRQALLNDFYERWKSEPLVVNKWLRIQATAPVADTLAQVKTLTQHAAFDAANPNKIYALLAAFAHANPRFHTAAGYRFIQQWIAKLDPQNPQVTARLASAYTNWQRYTPQLKSLMQTSLKEIAGLPKLSRDVGEIVAKSLGE